MTFILYLGNVLLSIQTLARLLKKNYLHTAERRVTEIKRSFHNPPTMKLVYDMPREKGDNFHTECKTNEILKLHVQCIAFIDMFALFLFYLLPHTANENRFQDALLSNSRGSNASTLIDMPYVYEQIASVGNIKKM